MVPLVAFFLTYIAPNFVHFHILNVEALDSFVHEPLAAFAGQDEQPENRIAVDAGHALDAANAHSFQEQLQDVDSPI